MSRIIVLIGAPGAGKGTQARLLESRLGIPQISTGDMFREMKKSDTPVAREIQKIMNSGALVPDEVTFEMVKERTSRDDCRATFVLDGFPRTPVQAKMLETLAQQQDKAIEAILIDVPYEKLEKRLTGRRNCPVCGEIYNIYSKPPEVEGRCDRHPEKELIHRADDKPDMVKNRLKTYKQNTRPLLEYYEKSGRLTKIDGTGTPEEIYAVLQKALAADNVTA